MLSSMFGHDIQHSFTIKCVCVYILFDISTML